MTEDKTEVPSTQRGGIGWLKGWCRWLTAHVCAVINCSSCTTFARLQRCRGRSTASTKKRWLHGFSTACFC